VDSLEQFTFLEDGFVEDTQEYQPINSNRVLQCFDEKTGEQVHVLRQGSRLSNIDQGYVELSSSDTRGPEELPFITSALPPGQKLQTFAQPGSTHHPLAHERVRCFTVFSRDG
jgi:hypothetical protein